MVSVLVIFADMSDINVPFITVKQVQSPFYLVKMPASAVVAISYTAVRGVDTEEGAVQRVLNPRRITSVKEFTLQVGHYPGTIVLNWVNETNPLKQANGLLQIPILEHSAQLIDGQHRVAGIKAAIAERKEIGEMQLAVALYEKLTTQQCADIFLSINTEQKTVPRSLVYDLYGVASEAMVDPAAERARDIALYLHESDESPYRNLIKLPGSAPRRFGIALSTVVGALKPLVEEKGPLDQVGVKELELQMRIILNYLSAIRHKCGEFWDDKDNVFQYAAGFAGAMEFLRSRLIPYCNIQRSFEQSTIEAALELSPTNVIRQSDVKGMAGGEASAKVASNLIVLFKGIGASGNLKI